jgi:hypothetical protein
MANPDTNDNLNDFDAKEALESINAYREIDILRKAFEVFLENSQLLSEVHGIPFAPELKKKDLILNI